MRGHRPEFHAQACGEKDLQGGSVELLRVRRHQCEPRARTCVMSKPKVAIASDHAGFALKEFLVKNVTDIAWLDEGPATDARVDYPDFAEKVARDVASGKAPRGVLVCGSGLGMCISANKIAGVRA